MDPTPTTQPYREGEAAYREGRSRNSHGYPADFWQAEEFAAGFRQAELERAADALERRSRAAQHR